MDRFLNYVLISVSLGLAIAVVFAAFTFKGAQAVETWAVVAAALSVIVATVTAWNTQRTQELQARQLQPDLLCRLTIDGPAGNKTLSIRNVGRSSAMQLQILCHVETGEDDSPSFEETLTFLLAGESAAWRLPKPFDQFKNRISVSATWEDTNGKRYNQRLTRTENDFKALSLSEILDQYGNRPDRTERVIQELQQIRSAVERMESTTESEMRHLQRLFRP